MKNRHAKAVVIGVSAGGLAALEKILPNLAPDLIVPVIVVQHIHPESDQFHLEHFQKMGPLPVKEAEDKETLHPGVIYFAVPDYHLLIERDKSLSLSHDEKINFSRPSIDVLFESAALAYGKELIGVILTGANHDGATGLAAIKKSGGITIVQNPATAEVAVMPQAAIDAAEIDYILDLDEITTLINNSLRSSA